MMLKDNVAIITGAGRGIGKAIAMEFAKQGATIVAAARTLQEVQQTANEIEQNGGQAIAVQTDISKKEDVQKLIAMAEKKFEKIDVMVCNASVFESVPFLKMEDKIWHELLNVNLTGTYYCIKEVLPIMIKNNYGRIITIASIIGKMGLPFYAAYSASKHGIIGLTKCVAREVGKTGITVNAICPGMVNTSMKDQFVKSDSSHIGMTEEKYIDFLKHFVPQGRFLEPTEIAGLAAYIASKNTYGMTGQAVNFCGGAGVY
jgi:NAD(P)-dependent dehydrogenase (short-subunit alcohol dehydrogenase family)